MVAAFVHHIICDRRFTQYIEAGAERGNASFRLADADERYKVRRVRWYVCHVHEIPDAKHECYAIVTRLRSYERV